MDNRLMGMFALLLLPPLAHAIDVTELWQPGDPLASEARMRAALETAVGDDALIIRTQIARTYVFRQNFEKARSILREVESGIDAAGPEARSRYWLELGRSYASHQHSAADQTDETRVLARAAYQSALAVTQRSRLDGLTVDVLHMIPFVETDPDWQLFWTRRALEVALESEQPAARGWESSIRNNLGETLFDQADYVSALEQFERALALRKRDGAPPTTVRDATWHVARTLRKLGQLERALKMQQDIANEAYAANAQRHYIHKELSLLYAALNDPERAAHFAEHSAALKR